jgi:hypothetical protein
MMPFFRVELTGFVSVLVLAGFFIRKYFFLSGYFAGIADLADFRLSF